MNETEKLEKLKRELEHNLWWLEHDLKNMHHGITSLRHQIKCHEEQLVQTEHYFNVLKETLKKIEESK